ncbi:hypothetical protein NDU88_001941 [Pleurodeles waltl]|uniref:Uncharacterized protein n=1 Tax=Pleurodeles waltl TaxID=8319 RepID=A0AAV7WNX7_PLEWA|nr:hypothetical protein NDU88_001941 [Pleurodeles waltl]
MPPGKPSRKLLFSEALRRQKVPPAEEHPLSPPSNMAHVTQSATMDRILQEISVVGCKLEVHGPFRSDALEVRLTADFSKETSERRRAFLCLRPCLRQLDVKYGLFELVRIWITKNGELRDFYDPEDLRVFLEGLQNQTQSMDTVTHIPQDKLGPLLSATLPAPALSLWAGPLPDSDSRGRDRERLTKSHDNRGQVLQAVAMHTQIADMDKSCSPLKPTLAPI